MLKGIAEEYGVNLLVENVVCLYENPMMRWDELAANFPNVCFVFDAKMAAFHEQEKLLYQKEYEWLWKNRHIRHYHVNDYGGGYREWEKLKTLPIGMGHIDFSEFFILSIVSAMMILLRWRQQPLTGRAKWILIC